MIITTIILPARWRLDTETASGFDEVLHPKLGRINAQIMRQNIRHTFNYVDGFRHTERTAIGDTARRLIVVYTASTFTWAAFMSYDPVQMRIQSGREFRGIRRRISAQPSSAKVR